MNIVKHFIKVFKMYLRRITCKHTNFHDGSCPFTGYTYTTCDNCGTRLGMRQTV